MATVLTQSLSLDTCMTKPTHIKWRHRKLAQLLKTGADLGLTLVDVADTSHDLEITRDAVAK